MYYEPLGVEFMSTIQVPGKDKLEGIRVSLCSISAMQYLSLGYGMLYTFFLSTLCSFTSYQFVNYMPAFVR